MPASVTTKPLHITEVTAGMVLRIAMRPGKHLNPQHNSTLKPPKKSGSAGAFSRTTVIARVAANDAQTGVITVDVQGRLPRDPIMRAVIPYSALKHVQRQLGAKLSEVIPIGGGPSAQRRPGIQALGLDAYRQVMNYQLVLI